MIWVYGILEAIYLQWRANVGLRLPPLHGGEIAIDPEKAEVEVAIANLSGPTGPKIYCVPVAIGAQAGRPAQCRSPIFKSAESKIFRSTYLVSMSAIFSVPKTLLRVMACDRILSCTHKSVTSRWRILPRPFLRAMPMAAVASERT